MAGSRHWTGWTCSSTAGCSPVRTRVPRWPAVEHYLAGANPPAAALVTAAMAWRLEPPSADEATALPSRELIPPYIQYLDDHIARLRAIDRHDLVARFQRWRARLLAPNP